MLTLPVPAVLHGDALAAELAAAGLPVTPLDVSVVGELLCLSTLDEEDRTVAEQVVRDHRLPPPTPEQIVTVTLEDRVDAALAANITYLATTRTPAGTSQQVDALTRQVSALIRLARGRLEAS